MYKVLFFERIIGVTPAARAFAHVEYLTALTTLGLAVGAGVEVCSAGIDAGLGVGATSVMGLIPAVIAYAGIEKAVIEVILHDAISDVSALASAESTVNEYRTFMAIQLETYEHLFSGGNHVLGS